MKWLRSLLILFSILCLTTSVSTPEAWADKPSGAKPAKAKKKGKKKKGKKRRSKRKKNRVTYTILPGDTLKGIAMEHGVSSAQIKAWNNLSSHNIRAGKKLTIWAKKKPRARHEKVHLVKKGQTFGSIAKKYKIDTQDLIAWNRRIDPRKLRPGMELKLYIKGPQSTSGSAGSANKGKLNGGEMLESGRGYLVRSGRRAYGTNLTVKLIRQAYRKTKRKFRKAPDVVVGDLSYKHGGYMAPHKSHQSGRDADISYYIKGVGNTRRFHVATPKNLDVAKQWFLFNTLIKTKKVHYIFVDYGLQKVLYEYAKKKGASKKYLSKVFQYPRGRGASAGIIRWSRGHDDHYHIRFKCEKKDKGCRDY